MKVADPFVAENTALICIAFSFSHCASPFLGQQETQIIYHILGLSINLSQFWLSIELEAGMAGSFGSWMGNKKIQPLNLDEPSWNGGSIQCRFFVLEAIVDYMPKPYT